MTFIHCAVDFMFFKQYFFVKVVRPYPLALQGCMRQGRKHGVLCQRTWGQLEVVGVEKGVFAESVIPCMLPKGLKKTSFIFPGYKATN